MKRLDNLLALVAIVACVSSIVWPVGYLETLLPTWAAWTLAVMLDTLALVLIIKQPKWGWAVAALVPRWLSSYLFLRQKGEWWEMVLVAAYVPATIAGIWDVMRGSRGGSRGGSRRVSRGSPKKARASKKKFVCERCGKSYATHAQLCGHKRWCKEGE